MGAFTALESNKFKQDYKIRSKKEDGIFNDCQCIDHQYNNTVYMKLSNSTPTPIFSQDFNEYY